MGGPHYEVGQALYLACFVAGGEAVHCRPLRPGRSGPTSAQRAKAKGERSLRKVENGGVLPGSCLGFPKPMPGGVGPVKVKLKANGVRRNGASSCPVSKAIRIEARRVETRLYGARCATRKPAPKGSPCRRRTVNGEAIRRCAIVLHRNLSLCIN